MNPCQVTLFITAVANVIAEDTDENELAILSVMFTQLADTLDTLALLKAQQTGEDLIEDIRFRNT